MGAVSQSPAPERPGRYTRSFGGLVGAMLVMVVIVVLAWVGLGLFRDEAEFEPTPIDYDASISALVENGATLAYPAQVPQGWRVNNLAYDPDVPVFTLALLTDDSDFVGVHHGREDLDAVLERLVDESPDEGGSVELTDGDGSTATWQVFTDDGGDTAYLRVGDERRDPTLTLVYGSAPEAQLRAVVASLRTTD